MQSSLLGICDYSKKCRDMTPTLQQKPKSRAEGQPVNMMARSHGEGKREECGEKADEES